MSQEKIERMAQIANEIDALAKEGVKLADETGTIFHLSKTEVASARGAGGMEYVPEAAKDEADSWNYVDYGWRSSGSEYC